MKKIETSRAPATQSVPQPTRLWRGMLRTEAQIKELEAMRREAFPHLPEYTCKT